MTATMEKLLRGIVGVLLAVAMVIGGGASLTAFAASNQTATAKSGEPTTATASAGSGKGTITITLPSAQTNDDNQTREETSTYNYKVYKVFNATNDGSSNSISYQLINSSWGVPTVSTGDNKFYKDDSGNVYFGTSSDAETNKEGELSVKIDGKTKYITPVTGLLSGDNASAVNSAVKTYIDNHSISTAADVSVKSSFDKLEITGLDYGYYYITTTTGTLVALTSTNPKGEATDKNDVPTVKKTIESVDNGQTGTDKKDKGSVNDTKNKAIAEVGSTVHYQSVITVGKGAEGYVFRDKMSSGLTFDANSVKVTYTGTAKDATATDLTSGTDYELKTTATDDYTFEIDFNKDTTAAKAAMAEGTKITITYTATVNDKALNTDDLAGQNGKNGATISYGNDPSNTSKTSETTVYNAKLTVKKTDGTKAVTGAKFKLKNAAGEYYVLGNDGGVTWTSTEASGTEVEATQVNGTGDATAVLQGLGSGTYTLIESTVPDGYNKAADQTITVKAATETAAFSSETNGNLNQTTEVVNNAGPVLPSTGGIGTTIFYILGAVIVAGAAFALVMRRRRRA